MPRMARWLLVALAAGLMLSGCAGRVRSQGAARPSSFGAIVARGTKPASQVAPCCRALAEGRISLAECYANPTCQSNGNRCCSNAVESIPARGI